jgi:acetolactate synthase-1/2/3 large subunit
MTSSIKETDSSTTSGGTTMTGGHALAASLRNQGVDTLFALPGIQLDGFFYALWEERDHIRVIHPRHEQSTTYMADGYARVTGREGVAVVVPGPGLLNAAAGLAVAYSCNSPVLAIAGQVRSDLIDRNVGALHEIKDQLGMIRSVTKHAARATTPEAIPGTLAEAFRQMRTGRPRPVEIEVPPDVFLGSGLVEIGDPTPPRERVGGDPDVIDRAAQILGRARNPVIFAGGGIQRAGAGAELLQLGELLQAPIVVSMNGKGAVSDRHYLAQGIVGQLELLPNADVILIAGSRYATEQGPVTPLVPGQRVIQIDIDPEEIGRNIEVAVGIEADLKPGLAQLAERTERYNLLRPSRKTELDLFKAAAAAKLNSIEPQAGLATAIRAEMPDEGIIGAEFTQVAYWSFLGMPIYQPNTFLAPGYQGALGYGFATALGAKVGKPDVPVISINGDGGFGYSMSELSTMVQHNIPVIAVVFNDQAFGNVKRIQVRQYGGREIASDLVNPDYQLLAKSFGITGRKATNAADLRVAVRESIKANEPTLIEVPVPAMPSMWDVLRS